MPDTKDLQEADGSAVLADVVRNTIVGTVTSAHDAEITTSCAGVVSAQGDASVKRSGAGAIIAHGGVETHKTAVAALLASAVEGNHVYNGVTVASDISVSRSWVGIALAPKMQVSDDSRVIVGPAAALILAAAILGVFGIVAALSVMATRRALAWRPKMPSVSWHRMGE
ncbi:MAG: hypothetical protein RBS78_02150 [Coriobacteriia bacterium]|jgi:hypothetical protein|nr:hypothetical protein [Coriobacteriia bacterium]